jgi:hypothetical protein
MVIEFQVRPLDSRQLELWLDAKLNAGSGYFLVAYTLMALGVFLWSSGHEVRSAADYLVVPAMIVVPVVATMTMRAIARRKFGLAPGFAEGRNVLHFSEAGVHHVGPSGTYRYPWTSFAGLEVTVGYIFLIFRPEGTLPVPIDALTTFGTTPDQAFLEELLPLVRAGRQDAAGVRA